VATFLVGKGKSVERIDFDHATPLPRPAHENAPGP